MRALPVHWHEGMFLRQHHFQAAARHQAEMTAQSSRWDQPYNWGVRAVEIDAGALTNFRFVVRRLQARMLDGTVVRVPQDTNLPEIELKPLKDGLADTVEVFLAVRALDLGRRNVTTAADTKVGDDPGRYRVEVDPQAADEVDGKTRPVEYRRLNLTLLTGDQDPAGYDILPLARVVRSTRGDTTPVLHRGYIPPLLSCDAWPLLREDVLQPVYYKIGSLVRDLGAVVRDRDITFLETDPEARLMFEQVRLLNEAAAVTRILARTDGLHPLTAYAELCRLIGMLAIFGPDRGIPELTDYDHDDLGGCFFELKRLLDQLLNMIGAERKFQQRPFAGAGLQMRVEVDDPWLAPGWQMFVGVESNMEGGDVVRLLTSGQMNMKIAAGSRVEEVYKAGHRGMVFRFEPAPPKMLPLTRKDTYFSLERSAEEWPFVQQTRRIAIRLNDRLMDGDLEGKKDVMLKGAAGKQPVLRFTLYVVPPKG